VAELFGLDDGASRARTLLARLAPVTSALEQGDLSRLGPAFSLGAATLQQVRRDPLLPPALAGPEWPGAELRSAYSRYQTAFAAALATWFADAGAHGTAGAAGRG
jgi:phenylacetic acid degradation operon negative regulatory protein